MSPTWDHYIQSIIHEWSKTLAKLGVTLIPLFFVLDCFMIPPQHLPRFAVYRAVTTGIVVAQYMFLRGTQPGKLSFLHGYLFSFVVGSMIALMTTDLGGFNSTYYAGLNLVVIAVNLMLPWRAVNSAVNSLLVVSLYVLLNLVFRSGVAVDTSVLVNNFYFLIATAIISVSINWVKEKLIRQEFDARSALQLARDALWTEMEVAKRIQTSLLPQVQHVSRCRVAATMVPAEHIGGDYYDVIENEDGELWITIGDVSGHGVESGLIMMMTQTSLFTAVNRMNGMPPSEVLNAVNGVLNENNRRLGTDRYMTLSALRLRNDELTFAGKHQDLLIWRAATGKVETIETTGTWLGVVERLRGVVRDRTVKVHDGDVLLLFTDGVTEAVDAHGVMYGQQRLLAEFERFATKDVEHIVSHVVNDVIHHMAAQSDDLTVLACRVGALSS
jgi:sigma-B regulation protein RsbU (phosphoserine phosphatase)